MTFLQLIFDPCLDGKHETCSRSHLVSDAPERLASRLVDANPVDYVVCDCACHRATVVDERRIELWDGINRYAAACGGDTSADTVSSQRMEAVTDILRAIDAEVRGRIALRFSAARPTKLETIDVPRHEIETLRSAHANFSRARDDREWNHAAIALFRAALPIIANTIRVDLETTGHAPRQSEGGS